jgi:HK97 gp10 family phage protein
MVRVTGLKAHIRHLERITRNVPRLADLELMKGGQRIGKSAKDSIKAGAVSGKHHVPSRPGEPPNADTHVLDRSIHNDRVEAYKVNVTEDAPYSVFQEYGTLHMAARPHMRPASLNERAGIIAAVVSAAQKGSE